MLRFEVVEADGALLRRFATRHEARYFMRMDDTLGLNVLPVVKVDYFSQALAKLGDALI